MTFRKSLALFFSHMIAVSARRMVVHESLAAAPGSFVSQGPAPATDMLTLRLALAPNNIAGLQAKMMSISTPGSSEHRQWLSADEVKSFVKPSSATTFAVMKFASTHGLNATVISPHEDWVSITLSVAQANDLFAAQYQVYSHPSMSNTITRTLSVSLPPELVGHIQVIHPTTAFLKPGSRTGSTTGHVQHNKRATPPSCDTSLASGVMTPACLQSIYGIPATPATQSNNALLVTAYVNQSAQKADLEQFLELLRPDVDPSESFTLLSLDGGNDPQNPSDTKDDEANLDIQYTAGIATGVPLKFLSVGGDFATGLLDTTTFIHGLEDPPTVVSTSYSLSEESFGFTLASKICDTYMSLGARGISLLFSSGDGGVRGGHDDISECKNNTFVATFPNSCPWVTSVGATIGFGPETAVNFTGGGFSNYFPIPSYQSDAVAGFLETLPTDFQGTFNSNGRGYPDVSLQGVNFQIVLGGEVTGVGGTSASTPTFASIISLINDQLIAAGKPVLGFLNPFLYYYASTALTDITAGHNSGVCPVSTVAFNAGVGWDPLTGSGTPIFDQLLAAAMGVAAPGSYNDTNTVHTSGAVVDTVSALSDDSATGTDGSDGSVRKYGPIIIGLLSGNLVLLLILVILGVGQYIRRGGTARQSSKYAPVKLREEDSMSKMAPYDVE
ncbi:family S53 protease-like protein [Mycena metata]|uniref:Family S53 protease-like protein n=1 Tax=Mycena metata TaxID=1033252 RepID=A0AAD7J1U0_9AGAR|nr:family S53 protease-like protein [Mycena metata]